MVSMLGIILEPHAVSRCDVQYEAQRVAFSGMLDRQNGQSFVVGAAGGAGFCMGMTRRTTMNTANAMIRKLITVFRKIQ